MYRPNQRSSGNGFVNLVVILLMTGALFFAYNTFIKEPEEPSLTPTPDPSIPTVAPLTPIATPLVPATIAPVTNNSGQTTVVMPSPAEDSSIFIPSVGVSAPIITAILRNNTWDISQLGTKVGYLQGTPWLDSGSNTVLSGHVEMSDGRTGVFAVLDEVSIGDEIVVTDAGQEYTYIIQEKRYVEPTDLTPLYPSESDQLTLITCSDYNFLSNNYETRLIVVANRT